jgi:YegS/Rv2252/BmrU family lipid kinase
MLPVTQRAVIVHNPASRNAPSRRRLEAAARPFAAHGWEVELQATAAPSHATEIARDAASSGAAVVFACGGDGTINEVINGIAGSDSALGVLRGGMGDVFGREAGIPRPPEEALEVLVKGERRRFDLGLANGRYFLMMAGAGFDAEVVRSVPRRPKRLLGSTSYALWGAWVMARYRSKPVTLQIDGAERTAELYWLMLANTRSYGGVIRIASSALVDDGLLDAFVFEARNPLRLAGAATRIARHRFEGSRDITQQRVRELEVLTPGLRVQIDGEYIGETPARFAVAPAALDILLPPGAVPSLFRQPAVGSRPSAISDGQP